MKPSELGKLEQKVMDILWQKKEASSREVLDELKNPNPLAYTTIATILQRLYEKGLVKKTEKGNTYFFSPKLSRQTFSKNVAKSFLSKFMSSFGDIAIASFAESIDELPKTKRNYFLKILQEYEKHK